MIKLIDLIMEAGGAKSGKMELLSLTPEKAKKYAENEFEKAGTSLEKEIPNFEKNFKDLQTKAKLGTTKRKDMPVIEKEDVEDLQKRLSKGYIDIEKPHAKETDKGNPFPNGLSGAKADHWLKNGLKKYDGADSNDDDVVKVTKKTVQINKLKPIQRQIYFDKSMDIIARLGIKASYKFMTGETFIISSDNFIIDGHHRFQSMMLIDPTMSSKALAIDLPLSKLLPMTLSYSDAIGNKRNN